MTTTRSLSCHARQRLFLGRQGEAASRMFRWSIPQFKVPAVDIWRFNLSDDPEQWCWSTWPDSTLSNLEPLFGTTNTDSITQLAWSADDEVAWHTDRTRFRPTGPTIIKSAQGWDVGSKWYMLEPRISSTKSWFLSEDKNGISYGIVVLLCLMHCSFMFRPHLSIQAKFQYRFLFAALWILHQFQDLHSVSDITLRLTGQQIRPKSSTKRMRLNLAPLASSLAAPLLFNFSHAQGHFTLCPIWRRFSELAMSRATTRWPQSNQYLKQDQWMQHQTFR